MAGLQEKRIFLNCKLEDYPNLRQYLLRQKVLSIRAGFSFFFGGDLILQPCFTMTAAAKLCKPFCSGTLAFGIEPSMARSTSESEPRPGTLQGHREERPQY